MHIQNYDINSLMANNFPGGNWPSKTGGKSGPGRGNNPPKGNNVMTEIDDLRFAVRNGLYKVSIRFGATGDSKQCYRLSVLSRGGFHLPDVGEFIKKGI